MEKRRTRRRKEDGYASKDDDDRPSRQEYQVAHWMKKNLKTKKTKFLNHNVVYFTANKAIDALLKSKFVECNEPLFNTRDQIIDYLDLMLEHKFYHRAKKVPVSLEDLQPNAIKKDETECAKEKEKDKEKEREKDEKKLKDKKREKETKENDTEKENGNEKSKEKKKRKIRLEMHPEQLFVDGAEAYVWIYDPIPIHYWIYGLILLLGAVAICLFPLWPSTLRKGVYYLSLAAAGFLVFILGLTVLRLIIFTVCWILTAGKLHFWIFPNLTEDVGFFASFWPLYESKYITGAKPAKDKRSKSKTKKKDKYSDAEDEKQSEAENLKSSQYDNDIKDVTDDDTNNKLNVKGSATTSESESEISGKDYEIINRSEVQNVN